MRSFSFVPQVSRRPPPPFPPPKHGPHPEDVWIYKRPCIIDAKQIQTQTQRHKHTHANSEVWLKLRKVARSRPGLAGAGEHKQVLISLVSFQGKDSELNITWTWCVYAEARQRPEAMFNQSGFKLNQRMAPEYC